MRTKQIRKVVRMKKSVWIIFVSLIVLLIVVGVGVIKMYTPTDTPLQSSAIDDNVQATQEATEEATQEPAITEELATMSVSDYMDEMTIGEKVAQMFWVRCPEVDAANVQQQYQFGGYILFGRDFESKDTEEVTGNIGSYQSASNTPMLIGVDEEGGTVCRVSYYSQFRSTKFGSPSQVYAEGGWNLIKRDAKEKATLLKSLGINVNLAPVCDLSTNPSDYIYLRAFGISAKATATFVKKVVKKSQNNGVGTVLKHFPGYGNNVNTHTGIAVDQRSYENFQTQDFLPFEAGIEAGAGCVLVSHNVVNCMDADNPASLSSNVHEILRDELGFNGVIMTDDLSMDAIKDYTDGQEAAVKAVLAGNDLLCCTDYKQQYQAVLAAVKDGTISEDMVDSAVQHVLQWKYDLGLLQ